MKTKILSLILLGSGVFATLFFSSNTTEDNTQITYEQEPPMPLEYTVQKLQHPLANGETMIFRVKYFNDPSLKKKIDVYNNGKVDLVLRDDGVAPDNVADDFIYATYLKTNTTQFKGLVTEYQNELNNRGSFLKFNGHDGKVIQSSTVTNFNFQAFDNFETVILNESLVNAIDCGANILKENSLFITDIDVVEDPARTNTSNANALGEYTFGYLIRNIVNTPVSGITAKDFLKDWLIKWKHTQSVNTTNDLEGRDGVFHLIKIWIVAAKRINNPNYNESYVLDGNWQTIWNNELTEEEILVSAPFKLTSIVNRIDLRGSLAYKNTIGNAGETRLIFTVLDENNVTNNFTNFIQGQVPMHINPGPLVENNVDALDWKGCNIILEYSNVQKNLCDLQLFAKRWYDLSALNRNSTAYKDELASIVRTVTDANAVPNKPNGTALARIRTNEKMFADFSANGPQSFYSGDWLKSFWELRQFEIGSNHLFKPVNVTNTPAEVQQYNIDPVVTWVMSSPVIKERVRRGNYNIPQNLLATSALLKQEIAEYYNIDLNVNPYTPVQSFSSASDTPDPVLKEIRHQISLNRCQGCHGGETQTVFTQVKPMPIGSTTQSNYWDMGNGINGYINEKIDSRTQFMFVTSSATPFGDEKGINYGKTFDYFINGLVDNLNRDKIVENEYNQTVSPFLTGRRYMSTSSGTYPNYVAGWQDDELDDNANESDQITSTNPIARGDDKMTGLFYVNDPSNEGTTAIQSGTLKGKGGKYPQMHDKKYGYNDLERRKIDLCQLLDMCCNCGFSIESSPQIPFELIKRIDFMPFPYASH